MPPVPNATVELSAAVKVIVLLTVKVLAFVRVNVPVVVVIVSPSIVPGNWKAVGIESVQLITVVPVQVPVAVI